MIKVICFDMWQTLGTYKINLYKEVLKVSKLNMSLREFALKKGKINIDESLDDKNRFIEKLRKLGVVNHNILNKIEDLYIKTHDSIYLYKETLDALNKLKEKGLILILITNVDEYAHRRIICLFPKNLFDFILTSYEVGVRKPNKEIFMNVLKKYEKVRPEEILMVGDSEDMDIKPSKELNWKTAFISRKGEKSKHADYNIGDLRELLKIL